MKYDIEDNGRSDAPQKTKTGIPNPPAPEPQLRPIPDRKVAPVYAGPTPNSKLMVRVIAIILLIAGSIGLILL